MKPTSVDIKVTVLPIRLRKPNVIYWTMGVPTYPVPFTPETEAKIRDVVEHGVADALWGGGSWDCCPRIEIT
ncbi:MAG TPA: hypothetical protein EYP19_00035, partial [Desulfobacterales bacterium]|nr:hypothetical protein [Desulfobacterales bacterium]